MRKITVVIFLLCALLGEGKAQDKSVVSITDLDSEFIQLKTSYVASIFINEIQSAFREERFPFFPEDCITKQATQRVMEIWAGSPFTIHVPERHFKGLITSMGYQIRGVNVKVAADTTLTQGVLNFNADGIIEDFHFALDDYQYGQVVLATDSQQESRRMALLFDFLEQFRTAYNRKDMSMISTMYGDDVLIITGYVYRTTGKTMDYQGLSQEKVEYNLYTKHEYLTNLQKVFEKNRFVSLFFDDIRIKKHPSIGNLYSATFLQKWRSTTYNDDGWLFLAIEFLSDTEMVAHIRTWQPYELNGVVFPRSEVFQLGNFEFK